MVIVNWNHEQAFDDKDFTAHRAGLAIRPKPVEETVVIQFYDDAGESWQDTYTIVETTRSVGERYNCDAGFVQSIQEIQQQWAQARADEDELRLHPPVADGSPEVG